MLMSERSGRWNARLWFYRRTCVTQGGVNDRGHARQGGVMKVTDFTKRALRSRRESQSMHAAGYTAIHVDSLLRHSDSDRIIDVKIGQDGKFIWVKIGKEG